MPAALDALQEVERYANTLKVLRKRHPKKSESDLMESLATIKEGDDAINDFMHQTARLRYAAGRGYRAVALPYRSSTLSLLVVLPVRQRLGALQHRLSGRGLARIARGLSRRSVLLSLPRFHLNTDAELTGALQALGMPTAFSEAADFSRMTGTASLKIDFVKHAADFTVDEEGTVAAAATVVGAVRKAASPHPRDAVAFNANHPFLFFLRDDRTGAVLFAGRVTSPVSPGA